MAAEHRQRKGSLAFRPRKRSRTQNPRILAWPKRKESKLLGFAGYKAGMTQVTMIDMREGSQTFKQEIVVPVTIVECPPLFVFGLRAYRSGLCEEVLFDVFSDPSSWNKEMRRAISLPKKLKHTVDELEKNKEKISDVYLLAATLPSSAGFGKKKPDIVELAIGGDVSQKIEYGKSLLGKQVRVSDVFKAGEFVDAISVSKGKGWQGAIKRFGVKRQRRKATGRVRHVGTLGPWHPAKVMYTARMAGQTGYHKRTIANIQIVEIGNDGKRVTPKGGFVNYGLVKSDYILLKGSVTGPKKRLIKLRASLIKEKPTPVSVRQILTASQQGM